MNTTTDTFANIPLAHIVTSRTNPRKHFHPGKLAELAESIKASGVHQPVLVRPLPGDRVADTAHMDPRPQWELVSGERRYRGSEMAGLATIPAMVRALSDNQVLEIQLVENLQRDDLTPLEEAEGYEALRDRPLQDGHPALTADQIAERIGKSRSYIYGRLKLLNLCPEGRQAMNEGWLEASTALLVARMPSHKLQNDALGNLRDYGGTPLSHREAAALIERQYMLKLNAAPFKSTDATLVPSAGSCRECPKRTGADPDLFADVKGADVCTDPACFRAKEGAHQERQLKAARESGATIIEGREAKSIMPYSWKAPEGYLRLDSVEDSPTDKPLRKIIGKLMEAEGITPTLVANPHKDGELVAVIDHATATRLLAQKGHQEHAEAVQAKADQSAKAAAEAQKAKDKERFEKAWRMELLRTTWTKIDGNESGMYTVPDIIIRSLAVGHLPNKEGCKELCKLLDLGKVAPDEALRDWIENHDEPEKALALVVMYADREWQHWRNGGENNERLIALAIDAAGDSGIVHTVQALVKKDHAAEIRARNKVQAGQAVSDPVQASAPLPSAAQAHGVRGEAKGKGKGKKTPAAPAMPRVSEGDARQGIAAAMQSNEAGGDCAPGGADPAVGDAADGGADGRATSPDAGASEPVPGARVRLVGVHMTGQLGHVIDQSTFGKGEWLINIDGLTAEYVFARHEFEVLSEEGAAA